MAEQHQSGWLHTTDRGALMELPRGNTEGAILRPYIDQIVALEKEKAEVSDRVKAVYAQVKDAHFSPKSVKTIVRYEMESDGQRIERESISADVARLLASLADFDQTPLGAAARSAGQ